jgi:hypothetical protein
MITSKDFIKLGIRQLIGKAKKYAKIDSSNFNSKTIKKDNVGRLVGYIAELGFKQHLNSKEIEYTWDGGNSYDYDFTIGGVRVDLKTKDRTVAPRIDYECSIAEYSNQDCEYFIFASLERNKAKNIYNRLWILGFISKDEYMKKSNQLRVGDIDPSNNWTVKEACRNLAISELYSIDSFFDRIGNKL